MSKGEQGNSIETRIPSSKTLSASAARLMSLIILLVLEYWKRTAPFYLKPVYGI